MEHQVRVTQEFIHPLFFNQMRQGNTLTGYVRDGKIYANRGKSDSAMFEICEPLPAPLPEVVGLRIIGRNIYAVYESVEPPTLEF